MSDRGIKQTLQFSLDWKASLLVLLLLPCMVLLGCWQLSRAEEKRELKAMFELRKTQQPVEITELSRSQDLRYLRVSLRGEFINNKVLLLDNKIYRGQFGYEVITPMRLVGSDFLVMVNRGWVVGDKSRRALPVIDSIDGEVAFIGEIYVPSGDMLTLGSEKTAGWPRVVQSLDLKLLAEEIGSDIFPYQVRVNTGVVGAYTPNWVIVNVQPEKHTAYAFQWFAMATTLLVIGVLANTNLWALIKK